MVFIWEIPKKLQLFTSKYLVSELDWVHSPSSNTFNSLLYQSNQHSKGITDYFNTQLYQSNQHSKGITDYLNTQLYQSNLHSKVITDYF